MAIADISKSLVHIQEKFIKRGPYTANITVPATAITATATVAGVKAGDYVIAQPTTSSDVVAGQFAVGAGCATDGTVIVSFGGTGTSGSKSYTFTVFARPFA